MTSVFVTSSGTDIGKTYLCCRLLEAISSTTKVRCIKPVVTGFDPAAVDASAVNTTAMNATDTARLLAAQHLPFDQAHIEATSPWRYRAALSADMAAARESRSVPFDDLIAFCQAAPGIELNLIEGIGGVMAPIDDRHTVLDWIAALDTSVLLVVGSYLGSLSHTLTAVDVLSRRGREPLAIVVSESIDEPVSTEETASTLARYCRDLPIAILPRNDAAAAASAVSRIQQLVNRG